MKTQFLMKIIRWFKNRLVRTPEKDGYYSAYLIVTLWMASMFAFGIAALGNPTGSSLSSHLMDIGKAVLLNGVLFSAGTIVIGALLSFLYIPIPRLILGSFIYTTGASVTILLLDKSGILFSFIIGIGYSLLAICFGLFLIVLSQMKNRRGGKWIVAALSSVLVLASIILFLKNNHNTEARQAVALPVINENPSEKGPYDYTFLTYGSGEDQHRSEFGEEVDITTSSVDATSFITKWGEKREDFWGFDASNLPVNGRVWVPEGKGPFPFVLMVHGNHLMEYFSTSGYDYLGEQLASRGFVAISVDEDFINYSSVSGIPNDDYELRAWVILKHLVELQEINQTAGNALYQKMNFDQIALIGHSRGGQAVAMAADHAAFFKDDDINDHFDSINIKAIVALAPTDVYVDGKKPTLRNISYLLLQGARDGDLNSFPGVGQFHRTYFNSDSKGFKASLYIEDANHSQFNTAWGRMDTSLPKGLFLNRRQLMEPEDQRLIAKGYISAFLEDIFYGKKQYERLFRDYRYGQSWLPDTTYISQYQDDTYKPIVQYSYSNEVLADGIKTVAHGFDELTVTTPKDSMGKDRSFDALLLKWKSPADYTIHLPKGYLRNQEPVLSLSMANMKLADDKDGKPKVQIKLETNDGVTVQLPLESFMSIPPVILTNYTPFGLFDSMFRGDKYKTSLQPVFQTFAIPIESFKRENPELKIEDVRKITFHFASDSGKILVQGIGLENK